MSEEHWFSSKLREIDRAECLNLLRTESVGRIAFADDSGPDMVPVNYVVDGDDIVITTTGYGALARAATNARVAFEVDQIDHFTASGWSVVVRGRAVRQSVLEPPERRPYPWADGSRTYLLRITPEVVSGRRLIPA